MKSKANNKLRNHEKNKNTNYYQKLFLKLMPCSMLMPIIYYCFFSQMYAMDGNLLPYY